MTMKRVVKLAPFAAIIVSLSIVSVSRAQCSHPHLHKLFGHHHRSAVLVQPTSSFMAMPMMSTATVPMMSTIATPTVSVLPSVASFGSVSAFPSVAAVPTMSAFPATAAFPSMSAFSGASLLRGTGLSSFDGMDANYSVTELNMINYLVQDLRQRVLTVTEARAKEAAAFHKKAYEQANATATAAAAASAAAAREGGATGTASTGLTSAQIEVLRILADELIQASKKKNEK